MLGTARTDANGNFKIRYRLPHGSPLVLFVIAEDGPVMLASAIGTGAKVRHEVVISERTTVATGTAFAQFVEGRNFHGNTYGMINAVKMAENMANPETGDIGEVLFNKPNGTDTSTYPTFNSLTNVVAGCVVDDANCQALFVATTPEGGTRADHGVVFRRQHRQIPVVKQVIRQIRMIRSISCRYWIRSISRH